MTNSSRVGDALRWIALAFTAGGLLHFIVFAIFGPPNWFYGVVEKPMQCATVVEGGQFLVGENSRFLEDRDVRGAPSVPSWHSHKGETVFHDSAGTLGLSLTLTRDRSGTQEERRVYTCSLASHTCRELLVADSSLREAVLVQGGGGTPAVVYTKAQWWAPFAKNYLRFLAALRDPSRRADESMKLLSLTEGETRGLSSGFYLQVSPNRQRVCFRRRDDRGYWSLHVLTLTSGEIRTWLSAWEGDRGSGQDWRVRWRSDSEALRMTGHVSGLARDAPRSDYRFLDVVYVIPEDTCYLLSAREHHRSGSPIKGAE